ncbi:HA1F protein, partial [Melanocharis versteri]|nr:HA1F protein [Melanocharis versteri]
VSSCALLSRGSIRGSDQLGYDEWEFLSLELGSGRFVVADGAAQVTERRWETDRVTVDGLRNHLEHTCVDAMQRWVKYGQEALECKEPPDVPVSGKEEHRVLTLSCHAYGFYPSTIGISWMKGDEIWDQEMQWGGIIPNCEGTLHTWARIEALPEEREQHWCRVEHPGVPEPGIFSWGEAGNVECG